MMHFGKRYAKNTGRMGGKKMRVLNTIKTALDIIYVETGKNPVTTSVDAYLIRASTKIDLAELLGVAVDVVGDLGIDGGKLQFTMVHLRHQRLDIGPA